MAYYFGLVEKDSDSAYGVRFPDIPGCFSASDDLDHVTDNAVEALGLYAEDVDALPVARGLEAIRSLPDVAEALRGGAFLIRVPVIENDSKIVRANISMEAGLLRTVDQAAERSKLTRSAFLAQAARHEIER